MTRCLLILAFGITVLASVRGQSHSRYDAEKLPPSYYPDEDSLAATIVEKAPKELLARHERLVRKYADEQAHHTAGLMSSGNVYSNWFEMQAYLDRMLQAVLPPELKNDPSIKIYLKKSGLYDTFTDGSGNVFLSLGVFAMVENEAELASLICYQLGHYRHRNSLYRYIEDALSDFDYKASNWIGNHIYKKRFDFRLAQETAADSLGMIWLCNGGYHPNAAASEYNAIARHLIRQTRQHPYLGLYSQGEFYKAAPQRHDKLQHWITNAPSSKQLYAVDSLAFHTLREEARTELLKTLLRTFYYDDCIELAFKFHTLDPSEKSHYYYLLEALRRKCCFNPNLWKQRFISHRYYASVPNDYKSTGKQPVEPFLTALDNEIMMYSARELAYMKTKFYWQKEPLFVTNEEAFDYFFRIGKKYHCTECLLTNALSFGTDSIRTFYLEEYLSHNDIAYREYATAALAKQLQTTDDDEKLTILAQFDVHIKQGEDLILPQVGKTGPADSIFYSIVSKMSDRTPLVLETLKFKNPRDYALFTEVSHIALKTGFTTALSVFSVNTSSREITIDNHRAFYDKVKLSNLDPRYWELLKRYGYNEIEFFMADYIELCYQGDSKSAADYIKLSQTTPAEILSTQKKTRSINIGIGSAVGEGHEINEFEYWTGLKELKFNALASDELNTAIRDAFSARDWKYESKYGKP